MSPKNVFITGCNRGIGLELVKQFLKGSSENIFATCRDPSKATELNDLAKAHPGKLHILKLEVTDYPAFKSLLDHVSKVVGDNGLNLMINNAGMLPDSPLTGKATSKEDMRQAYEVNTIAPTFLTIEFLPLLKKAAEKNSDKPIGIDRAAVIMMSSSVGSIAENGMGRLLAYRCSKIALNMAMKNLSLEFKDQNIFIMAMHPGWVKTDMGGSNAKITTEECCSNMVKTMEGFTDADHGVFKRYDNTTVQW